MWTSGHIPFSTLHPWPTLLKVEIEGTCFGERGWAGQPRLTISCHIVARELLKVGGLKTCVVPVNCAHDPWPGLLEHLRSAEGTVITSSRLSHGKTAIALVNLKENTLTAIPENRAKYRVWGWMNLAWNPKSIWPQVSNLTSHL